MSVDLSTTEQVELAQNVYDEATTALAAATLREEEIDAVMKSLRESLAAMKLNIIAKSAIRMEAVEARRSAFAEHKRAKDALNEAKRAAKEQKKAEKEVAKAANAAGKAKKAGATATA
jgi:hypothetical protein